MTSVIVAVRNQLAMNRLFWENLCRTTDGPFELIVVDNGSTDGSREFFRSLPSDRVRVVENDGNYSYPHCQNQGIAAAKGDVLAFLNNDQLMSPHWDSRMIEVLGRDGRHVLSCATVDCMGDAHQTRARSARWKRIKYPVVFLFGHSRTALRLLVRLMYGGRFEKYCEKQYKKYGTQTVVGFSGSMIVMNRTALEKLGPWDPSMQAADFDLFCRTAQRFFEVGDLRPMSIVRGVYAHHYRRLTLKGEKYPPFVDAASLRSLDEKWAATRAKEWFAQCDRNQTELVP